MGRIGEFMRPGKTNTTEALSRATEGATLSFWKQRFGTELHSQYVISFAPDAKAPGHHRIEVRLARPGKRLHNCRWRQ